MSALRSTGTALLLSALLAAGGAPARAQGTEATAQALFDQGVSLMEAGRHADAITKLEESYRLEADTGTRYRLAICYEQVGRLASSWAAWNEVADRLDGAGEKANAAKARARAEALRPRLSYMRVGVAPAAAAVEDLVVKRDGVEVGRGTWGVAIPVDAGEHRITAAAPGRKGWETSIDVPASGAGQSDPVSVDVPELEEAPSGPSGPAAQSGGSWRLPLVLTAGSIGIVGLGVGAGFGGAAITQWEAALGRCAGGARDRCDEQGIQLGREADTFATISNVGFIVGGAGLAAAGIFWLVLPSGSPRPPAARWVAPIVSRDVAGAVVGGAF